MRRFLWSLASLAALVVGLIIGWIVAVDKMGPSDYPDSYYNSVSLSIDSSTQLNTPFFLHFESHPHVPQIRVLSEKTSYKGPSMNQTLNAELELEVFDSSGKSLGKEVLGPYYEFFRGGLFKHLKSKSGKLSVVVQRSPPAGEELLVTVFDEGLIADFPGPGFPVN